MATTYYVRTYNCSFPTKAANCTSRNNVLNFTTDTSGTITVASNFLSNFTENIPNSGVFYLVDPSNAARTSIKGTYNSGSYGGYKPFLTGNVASKTYITSTFNYLGSEKTYINTWGGYTSGTLSTLKKEYCTQFENSKTFKDSGDEESWGSDNGQINMILFSCTFDDDAGKIYYFPIFYMGNDPLRDETIVI